MPGPGRAGEGRPAPGKPAQPAADTGAGCPGRGQRQEGPAVQGAVQKCPPPPAVCRLLEPGTSPAQRLPPPLRALVSPSGCLSGLVPDNHRARHCHYHLLIRAELQGRQEWQAHVPVPAEEARPRPLLVAGHPLPFPSSSCRPPDSGTSSAACTRGPGPRPLCGLRVAHVP